MDLKLIKHLLLVHECGSFSRAAPVLDIAQPALGRQIQKLERECGVPLLYRNGRGVVLTPEGERLIEGMRPMLQQIEALVESLSESRARPQGAVTLGLTPTMLELFGLRLVTAMREKYPQVKLNIVSGYSGYIHEWLAAGSLDLALLHDARRSKHIAVDHLATASLHLVSAPARVEPSWRDAQALRLEQLAALPLVLPASKHGLRHTLEQACRSGHVKLAIEYEMDTLSLMKELVVAGHAHTVLAIPAIQGELQSGLLQARRITDPEVTTRLMLATAINRPYTPALRAVQTELGRAMRQAAEASPIPMALRFA